MTIRHAIISLITLYLISGVAVAQERPITNTNADDLELIQTFGRGQVNSVAYAPNGEWIAVASTAGTWLYDARELDTARRPALLNSRANVLSVAFNRDSQQLAVGTEQALQIWNLSDLSLQTSVQARTGVNDVAFHPDGTYLAFTGGESSNRHIRILNTTTFAIVHELEGHNNSALSLAYTPDGNTLVSGSADRTIIVWDAETGDNLTTLEGHTNDVADLAFSPDGRLLISVSNDDTIRLWQVVENIPQPLETIEEIEVQEGDNIGHRGDVNTVAFAPDGTTFITGGDDDTLRLWDTTTRDQLLVIDTERDVEEAALAPDGQRIVTAGFNIDVQLWDITTGDLISQAVGHTDDIRAITFSPDSSAMLIANADENIWRWQRDTLDAQLTQLPIITGEFSFAANNKRSLTYAPDGSYIAFQDGFNVQVWTPDLSERIALLDGPGVTITLAISPDSSLVAYSGSEGVFVFDARNGNLLATLEGHTDWVEIVEFSPDQTLLATGARDGTVRVYGIPEVQTNEE